MPEINTKLGSETLQLTHKEVMAAICHERTTWTSDTAESISWDIIRSIDWSNEALMHKSLQWIVKQYLDTNYPI